MEIFGIGLPELALIMVIILVVFGPEQLPEIAKKLGKTTRDLRRSLNDINNEVNEFKQPIEEFKQLTSLSATDPKTDSNLIVADDSDLPPAGQATEGTVTPVQPEANRPAPAGPPAPATDSDSVDAEDLSTPM